MSSRIRQAYADASGGQIHYRRVDGDDVSHAPVILLHRTPASSACFARMLDLLAGRRTAIAFDTPSFGASFRPSGRPAAAQYGLWFVEALDALGIDTFHLCAHHTGTHFATEIAAMVPHRVRTLMLSGVLYADAETRSTMAATIGRARRIDADGAYLVDAWTTMRGLFATFDADLVHAETLGALATIDGRDQAFGAIHAQDFKAVLRRVRCPVAVAQASDDPLAPMLDALRADHPEIPIETIGPAFLAAPELQPDRYVAALLAFVATHDSSRQPIPTPMTDRRFQLLRTPKGFDLEQINVERPQPGPGEVLVRIKAVSLNRRDVGVRDFSYPVAPEADRFTALSDGAGEIVAVGPDVTDFAVGDRVCSTFFSGWREGRPTLPGLFSALGAGGRGVFADHVVFATSGIARVPDGWSDEEAACLACAGVTAWSALMTLGRLQRDDWVLVIGTGGVALFALQIAVAAGARVVILSSSDEKLDRAVALGATAIVNYNTHPQWDAVVRELTGGGVQHAVELGGVGTLPKSIASMGLAGHVALIGALAGFGGDIPGIAMIMSALRVSAVMVGPHADHLALTAFMVEHGLRPIIDSVFDAGSAEDAYRRIEGGAFGKVVIRLV